MPRPPMTIHVVPAKAGTQGNRVTARPWVPAFTGMTDNKGIHVGFSSGASPAFSSPGRILSMPSQGDRKSK